MKLRVRNGPNECHSAAAAVRIVSMGMSFCPLQRLIVLSGRRIEEMWSNRFEWRVFERIKGNFE
jgi:hypothetical protein